MKEQKREGGKNWREDERMTKSDTETKRERDRERVR